MGLLIKLSNEWINYSLRNPVGVMTLGCTWLLHRPSHLFTSTSSLQVRWRRPSSSYSSFRTMWTMNLPAKINYDNKLKKIENRKRYLPLIKCICDGNVSHSSSPFCWPTTTRACKLINTIIIHKIRDIVCDLRWDDWKICVDAGHPIRFVKIVFCTIPMLETDWRVSEWLAGNWLLYRTMNNFNFSAGHRKHSAFIPDFPIW